MQIPLIVRSLQKWKDEHLVWDPEKFGGITKLVFGYREIWTPEITHWNSFDSKSYISRTFDRQSMDVKNDGTVEWFPSATFKSHCSLDLRDFPADTQTCHQSVGLWNQNTSEVNLIPDEEYLSTEPEIKGPIYVSKRFRSQEWDIVDLNMERYEVHGVGSYAFLSLQQNGIDYTIANPILTFNISGGNK